MDGGTIPTYQFFLLLCMARVNNGDDDISMYTLLFRHLIVTNSKTIFARSKNFILDFLGIKRQAQALIMGAGCPKQIFAIYF